ncbi:MAG: helix-turn-helix domain-containing protein [Candidatus Woesearchaeota archaeon]|nr:helix-turn-helix domain-containing protein [Candidatus Woesearchaeota archaeon]
MKQCAVFEAAELLGKKWTFPLLQQIELHGGKGFNELMRQMRTISPKILTERLKALEEQRIIKKETTEKDQARTSYFITEKGKELQKLLTQFRAWSTKYDATIAGCEERECVQCEKY